MALEVKLVNSCLNTPPLGNVEEHKYECDCYYYDHYQQRQVEKHRLFMVRVYEVYKQHHKHKQKTDKEGCGLCAVVLNQDGKQYVK